MAQQPTLDPIDAEILKRVANQIRRRNVVLWTGAGINHDAGLPTGAGLVRNIREQCTDRERKQLEPLGEVLPDVAEAFVRQRANSRNELIQIVQTALSITPQSTKAYELIADIPQITNIVTTNYDHCIENAYGNTLEVAYDDQSLSKLPTEPDVTYFKLHGDITHSDILITRSDYTEHICNRWQPLLCTAVRNLATRFCILFVGYGHNDPNIHAVFDQLLECVGPLARECFFVSRSRRDHLDRFPITQIQANGLDAIQYLHDEVLKHLAEDTDKGLVLPHLASPLLKKHFGVDVSWKLDSKGQPKLKSFGTDEGGAFENKINFTIKGDAVDKLSTFHEGKDFSPVDIPVEQIVDFSLFAGDVPLPFDFPTHITISKDTNLDGVLVGGDPPFRIKCKITLRPVSDDSFDLFVEGKGFSAVILSLQANRAGNGNMKCEFPADPFEGATVCRFLLWWIQGGVPTFISDDGDKQFPLPSTRLVESVSDQVLEKISAILDLCNIVAMISAHYGVQIQIPADFSDEDADMLSLVEDAMRGRKRPINELTLELSNKKAKDLMSQLEESQSFSVRDKHLQIVTLFGQQLSLGTPCVEAIDAIVENSEHVKQVIEGDDESVSVVIKSLSDQLLLSFEKRDTSTIDKNGE